MHCEFQNVATDLARSVPEMSSDLAIPGKEFGLGRSQKIEELSQLSLYIVRNDDIVDKVVLGASLTDYIGHEEVNDPSVVEKLLPLQTV